MWTWLSTQVNAAATCLCVGISTGCVCLPDYLGETAGVLGMPVCPQERSRVDPVGVATVLEHIYAVGRGRVVFLEVASDVMDAEEVPELRAALAERLGVSVYPPEEAERSDPALPAGTPKHRETGEIGMGLLVERAVQDDLGRWVLSVGYVRSGLDAQGFDFTLELADDGWRVVDIRETWVA